MACRLIGAKPLTEPAEILLIGPIGTNHCELSTEIYTFLFMKLLKTVVCETAAILSQRQVRSPTSGDCQRETVGHIFIDEHLMNISPISFIKEVHYILSVVSRICTVV